MPSASAERSVGAQGFAPSHREGAKPCAPTGPRRRAALCGLCSRLGPGEALEAFVARAAPEAAVEADQRDVARRAAGYFQGCGQLERVQGSQAVTGVAVYEFRGLANELEVDRHDSVTIPVGLEVGGSSAVI